MKRFALILALVLILLCPTVCAEAVQEPAFGREFSSEYAAYGGYVTLRYTVCNTLDESISAVTVSDPLVGEAGYVEMLSPGEKCVFTARIRITADCLSTPTLSYQMGGETRTVTVLQKGVTLENAVLSADLTEETGEDGHMLILTVINQGNTPVYGVKAVDQLLGDMGAAAAVLNPGESTRFERLLTTGGTHLCRVSAQSASGQALEVDSNALDTLSYDLPLSDGQTASAEPQPIETSPDGEDDPLDAIPDGVSFHMADNPQTYRNMMLGAGAVLCALGAGAWLTATVRRRHERRLRLKKRQERKKQRQSTPKKSGTQKSEEKKA